MSGNPLAALLGLALWLAAPPARAEATPAAADSSAPAAPRGVTGAGDSSTPAAPRGVTGAGAAIDPERTPLPASVLAAERLRRAQTVSLARAIESLSGVRTLSTGEQIGKPVLRGASGPRALVLENGYRLEDYSWSDEDAPSADPRIADHVDVIRGPASVLYGSDALGGAVNAVPADLPDARGRDPFTRTVLEAYGASNNDELGGALRFEGASGALGGRLLIVGRSGGDLHTPDGAIPHTGFGAGNGEAALGVRTAQGGATLRYAHNGGEFELREAGTTAPAQTTHRLGDDRIQLGGDFMLGALRFEARAQWQGHARIVRGGTPESEQSRLRLDTYALDLLAHHGTGAVRGTLGVSGLAQTNDTRGPIPVVPDARMHSAAGFGLEEIELGRWSLLGGARFDQRHLETDDNANLGLPDQARDDQEVSVNAGALYRVTAVVALAASAGRGWRAPSLFESYANGPRPGEVRFELGNPDLEPEHNFEADAGVRVRHPRLTLDVTGFVNRIERFIYPAATGDTRVVGSETLPVYEYTQADARLAGGELAVEWKAAAPVTARARADYVNGRNLDLDQPLAWVPPLRAVLGVEGHATSPSWAESARLGLEVEHVSEQTELSPLDTPADAYTLLHLDAGMTRRVGGRNIEIYLRVHNVADHAYRSFLSRYKRFADDPGRNVVLRLSTDL